jgi:PAS domain S-box-containing protein
MRIVRPAIFALFFLLSYEPSALGADTQIRVGVYHNPPLTVVEENGGVRGFFIDVLEHIAQEEGWKIEYLPDSWSQCLKNLENGKIDLLGVIGYSKERDKIYEFTYEAVLSEWAQVYTFDESGIDSIVDLQGEKVAVLQGDQHYTNLKNLVNQFGINVRFIEAFEYEDVMGIVEVGKCQAGVVSHFFGIENENDYMIYKNPIIFSPQKLYFAVPKGKHRNLLFALDRNLRRLKDNKQSIYYQLINSWFHPKADGVFPGWAIWSMAVVVGLFVIFLITSVVLKFQVGAKTAELSEKNRALVAEIEQREQAETALQRTQYMIEHSGEPAFWLGPDAGFIYVNQAACQSLGYTREELLSMTVHDIDPDFPREIWPEHWNKLKNIGTFIVESHHRTKEGRIFPVELTVNYVNFENQEYHCAFARDITERKMAENALKESESKFRSYFDLSPQAAARTKFETGEIVDINQKFCEVFEFSREEILGRTPVELGIYSNKSREGFCMILEALGEVHGWETDFKAKDGSMHTALMYARIVQMEGETNILKIFHDITDIKRLEAQFQQSQKMEAIGTLAGGIAHDFNNLLMGIQGRTSLMMLESDPDLIDFEHLREIEKYVINAAELTKQLLGFARGGKYEVKPTDLNDLVATSVHLFGRTKKEINIHQKYQDNIWTVDVDRGQINQVLLNIYVNAWQAMPEGGDLYVHTANVDLEDSFTKAYGVSSGRCIKISITDTGIGMDESSLKKVFDPFFTTKAKERGTGLGMASAYGIVKNHDGIITAESEIGQGTTFSIYLPASEKDIIAKKKSKHQILGGSETILLIDDEQLIINVGTRLLEKMGYEVLAADNGKEGIEVYTQNMDAIALVILDMVMPDVNGGEVYDRIKAINPEVKVLLSSGYSVDGQASEILKRGCNGFVQKPFSATTLSGKIRQILNPNQKRA